MQASNLPANDPQGARASFLCAHEEGVKRGREGGREEVEAGKGGAAPSAAAATSACNASPRATEILIAQHSCIIADSTGGLV